MDTGGKSSASLTYKKLLSRATKIAFALLNRQVIFGSEGETLFNKNVEKQVTLVNPSSGAKERVHLCLPGDRIALVGWGGGIINLF